MAAIMDEDFSLADTFHTAPPNSPVQPNAPPALPLNAQLPTNGFRSANVLMASSGEPISSTTMLGQEAEIKAAGQTPASNHCEPSAPSASNGQRPPSEGGAADNAAPPLASEQGDAPAMPKEEATSPAFSSAAVNGSEPTASAMLDEQACAPNGAASLNGTTPPPPPPPPPEVPSPPNTPEPLPRRRLRSRASRLDFELSRVSDSPPRIDGDWEQSPEGLREDVHKQEALVWDRVRPRRRRTSNYWYDRDRQKAWYVQEEYVSGGLGDGGEECNGTCGVQGLMWRGEDNVIDSEEE